MRVLVFILLLCSVTELYAWPWRKKKQAPVLPPTPEKSDETGEIPDVVEPVFPGEDFPEITIHDLPKPVRPILGKGRIRAELLRSFLLSVNSRADREFTATLVNLYVAEAEAEGIDHDIAFAQMCLETGFLRFGGLVSPDMNNFCGLGSIGPGEPGERFSSVELGVRAHIQHLKAYATEQPIVRELVDPRYRFVRRGSSPVLQGLAGTWAADKDYADKIEAILARLYRFTGER
ncbi:MAG: glucosaminidase domain-containing protein [Treponema sp.]|jgi:hypothetical protein|nr:glucosaminidase domain-containing protein [Treponema sp.]